MSPTSCLVVALASAGAATVTGAIGYGYAVITVPIALLAVSGRVLSPAIVMVEIALNLYALWWYRDSLRRILPRIAPLVIGLVPGVAIGAVLLGRVSSAPVKLAALGALLPVILLQASGHRWHIRSERRAAPALGGGVGLLYGVTAIAGPPLAVFWNNQAMPRDEFKCALATVRGLLGGFAFVAYAGLGLVTHASASLVPLLLPGVLLGVPLGHALARKVDLVTFRRLCTSFDGYIVAFGVARTLVELGVASALAYLRLVAVALLDAYLLRRHFRARAAAPQLALEAA